MKEILHCPPNYCSASLGYATPEESGISSRAIIRFLEQADALGIHLHSMVLLRHGKVCAEGYWAPYAPEYLHPMFSFGKSLASTAIGFAVQEGKLSLSDRLVDIFPDKLPDSVSENLSLCTIHDLLVMGCGHETEPFFEPEENEDWIRSFLAHEFKYRPGTMFQYNTAGTNMLSAALFRKTGQHLTAYLRPRLFGPLGIGRTEISTLPGGIEAPGAGFKLHTEDMVRFISFLANRGVWEGKRLLNEEWFDRATSRQIATQNEVYHTDSPDWLRGYCYQFWRCVPEGVYRADGMFGQFGIVMEKQDAILVLTEATDRTQEILTAVWDILLPAMGDEPLTPDAAAHAVLQDRLANATLCQFHAAVPAAFGTVSQLANTPLPFTGKTYTDGGSSSLDIRRLSTFSFQPASPALSEKRLRFTQAAPHTTPGSTGHGIFGDLSLQIEMEDFHPDHCSCGKTAYELMIGMNGRFAYSTVDDHVYAAIGHWRSLNVLEISVHAPESVLAAQLIFRFEAERLFVEYDINPFTGPSDPPAVFHAL